MTERKTRGLGSVSPGRRRHEFTSEEAREAGRKGGVAVSRDREHMVEMGRKGGIASAIARRKVRP